MLPTSLTSAAQTIARIKDAHKSFPGHKALDGLNLEIRRGELLALLGPNGAGKTTTVHLLTGQIRADQGQVTIWGGCPTSLDVRQRMGVTPQNIDFPGTLTGREILGLVSRHYKTPRAVGDLIEPFGLGRIADRQTTGLSGGEKRRLALACAFCGSPELVFLDEPTTGLDVEARQSLWQIVKTYVAEGGTVLLTTHYLEEAEALASRIAMVVNGRIVREGCVSDIKKQVGFKRVRLNASSLPELPHVARQESDGRLHTLYSQDADALLRALVEKNVDFRDVEILPVSLEQAFLSLLDENRMEIKAQ